MARKNDYHLRQTGQEVQDILDAVEGKAQKDLDAVEGNVAVFDDAGNPVDSGQSIGDAGVPYLFLLTEDMSEDDKAAAQAHNVEVLDSLTSKAEAYGDNLFTQRRIAVWYWPSTFLYEMILLRAIKNDDSYTIYYSVFRETKGGYIAYSKAIIANGLWNEHIYAGDGLLFRWSDFRERHLGREGEEFLAGKRIDVDENLVPYEDANVNNCRYYHRHYGLSTNWVLIGSSDPARRYYSVFFEDISRRIELRVYENDDVITIWHSKTDAVDLVILDGGHAPSV